MKVKKNLNGIILKLTKNGLLPRDTRTFAEICDTADEVLFDSMLANPNHVLYHILPEIKENPYNMRPRVHNRSLPKIECSQFKQNVINRILYKNVY